MSVLIRPIVTEKMTNQSERFNRYGFIVEKKASKSQIKREVEKHYNVSVEKINTMIYGGKSSTRYTKTGIVHGKKKSYKKAIVTLVEGDSIDFYSNI